MWRITLVNIFSILILYNICTWCLLFQKFSYYDIAVFYYFLLFFLKFCLKQLMQWDSSWLFCGVFLSDNFFTISYVFVPVAAGAPSGVRVADRPSDPHVTFSPVLLLKQYNPTAPQLFYVRATCTLLRFTLRYKRG